MPIPTIVAALSALCLAQPGGGDVVNDDPKAEGKFLGEIRQLTFSEQWSKAGEAYFSPNGSEIGFQAIPAGSESHNYSMYAQRLDPAGSFTSDAFELAPDSSANTCAWFHPTEPGVILFASTLVEPSEDNVPGYQRGSGRYRWAFPAEMKVVRFQPPVDEKTTQDVHDAVRDLLSPPKGWKDGFYDDGHQYGWSPAPEAYCSLDIVIDKPGYTAECSYSPDARHILYAQVDQAKSDALGAPDADLWVYDTESEEHTILVEADGYDGGPFFSPDAKWICYRSDRRGDNLLQLFVAELAYDESGKITGISREIQITDNQDVNWAPFWHPSGEFMVYASSQVSHGNYEVFAIPFDANDPEKKQEPVRITYASGFDGLPVFSADGEWMMWTAQRGEDRSPDGKASSQLWIAKWKGLSGGE